MTVTKKWINGYLKYLGSLMESFYIKKDVEVEYDSEYNPFRIATNEFYNLLELQERVSLDYRLRKMVAKATLDGKKKTEINKLSKIDVIVADQELAKTAIRILDFMKGRYTTENFNYNIVFNDSDEVEDILDEYSDDI